MSENFSSNGGKESNNLNSNRIIKEDQSNFLTQKPPLPKKPEHSVNSTTERNLHHLSNNSSFSAVDRSSVKIEKFPTFCRTLDSDNSPQRVRNSLRKSIENNEVKVINSPYGNEIKIKTLNGNISSYSLGLYFAFFFAYAFL